MLTEANSSYLVLVEDYFVPPCSIPSVDSKIYHLLDSAILLPRAVYRIFCS